ncbi:hypothetical protein FVEN_g2144 [Fusarium venenatum]|uniref:Ketoisovalerate reductase n=1 Tax=Fusarium venenatum TaxID=56646 RepID=A0A2L2SPN6_9HYPO|nr:uncharacterized protein FVRRES_12557 [Fusarium venenatum]KAG8360036.1 hypothetical protein FVEN_g2144 [Fusarium venenatum]KAH6979167.1 ketoisovalerate reductase [Fusarium venenatum]CEI39866.1 unnamed protein product [Fusarium venenatum]
MAVQEYPHWLASILADTSPPPKLYAWSPANLDFDSGQIDKIPKDQRKLGFQDDSPSPRNRIYIIGPGNIGRLYACYMAQHANQLPITLVVHRKELLSSWMMSEGLGIIDPVNGTVLKNKDFDVEWWTETQPNHGPIREVADGKKLRNVFVSTKAEDGLAEVDRMRRYLGRSSSVVFAQNGMCKLWPPHGPLYVASRYSLGDEPTFSACVVKHGVSSAGPFLSVHAAPADAYIGTVFCSKRLKRHIDDPFIRCIVTSPCLNTHRVSSGELWLLQLEKLVINAAINPLTAILRCKTGFLFMSYDPRDPLARVLDKLLWQTSAVIQELIYHDSSLDMVISYVRESQPHITSKQHFYKSFKNTRHKIAQRFSQPMLKSNLFVFGRKISEHRSSMLQDIEAGRKTEIRDFNGWIIDMARFLNTGLDVSIHSGLITLIERKEVFIKDELANRLSV